MTKDEFKRFILDNLEQIEPTINKPATPELAALIAECKRVAYTLGLHALAYQLPDLEELKTPLACCNSLRLCLAALETEQPTDGILNLEQAAAYLSYKPAGLRKLVAQKRIQYSQNGRGPIRFRKEWLDEFIQGQAGGPQDILRSPAQKRTKPAPIKTDAPLFGFDPRLIR